MAKYPEALDLNLGWQMVRHGVPWSTGLLRCASSVLSSFRAGSPAKGCLSASVQPLRLQ